MLTIKVTVIKCQSPIYSVLHETITFDVNQSLFSSFVDLITVVDSFTFDTVQHIFINK